MAAEVPDTYSPKVVLLTGGAGFIGSNVLLHLVVKYPNVQWYCFDSLEYCACMKNLDAIIRLKNFKFIRGNICTQDIVRHVLEEYSIDTIMHFAAQTHVDNSFGNSFAFTQTNVMGTHVLLESAKSYGGIRRFIHVSTDEVYGEIDGDHVDEDSVLRPTQPYAAAKAGAEHLVLAYYKSYQLPVIITRGNNVYGPNQFPEKVIPKFINLILRGQKLPIHGDGSALRSYLYCEDVARAFDLILHKGTTGSIYNIGIDTETSVKEVAAKLYEIMGVAYDASKACEFVEDRKFNDKRYAIRSDRLKALGWKPEIGFDDGLRRTVAWYRENKDNWGNIDDALVPHPRLVTDLSHRA
jgi:UDP-glucose 4,6-dehydratase